MVENFVDFFYIWIGVVNISSVIYFYFILYLYYILYFIYINKIEFCMIEKK